MSREMKYQRWSNVPRIELGDQLDAHITKTIVWKEKKKKEKVQDMITKHLQGCQNTFKDV